MLFEYDLFIEFIVVVCMIYKYIIRVYFLFLKFYVVLNCMFKLYVLKFIGYIGFFCKNSIIK